MKISEFDDTREYRNENFRIKNLVANEKDKHYNIIRNYLLQSETPEEFSGLILDDKSLELSNIYIQVFRNSVSQYDRTINMLLDALPNKRITTADVGGLLIGTVDFSVRLPNGIGDGEVVYDVIESGINLQLLNYVATISGEAIPIYYSDMMDFKHNDIVETISGRFMVYSYEGIVVFVRW